MAPLMVVGWFVVEHFRRQSEPWKKRADFRTYFEPIVNEYAAMDACEIQAVYRRGMNFIDWDEFNRRTKEVRLYIHGNKAAFDIACNIMNGVAFGDHGDRPKNQAAKDELLKRLRQVLHFSRP
jgi:hypothetical protein